MRLRKSNTAIERDVVGPEKLERDVKLGRGGISRHRVHRANAAAYPWRA